MEKITKIFPKLLDKHFYFNTLKVLMWLNSLNEAHPIEIVSKKLNVNILSTGYKNCH